MASVIKTCQEIKSYQPFNLERDKGAEGKDDPDDGAYEQAKPEDPRLAVRGLFPRALVGRKLVWLLLTEPKNSSYF